MLLVFVIMDLILIFIGLGVLGSSRDSVNDKAKAIFLLCIVVFIVFSFYDDPLAAFWNFITRKVI